MEKSKNALNIMENILNGLDAMIYVTVPDTGEILFMNDQMKNHYEINGDIVGKYCYKVLQDNLNKRCSFCPCHQLDKDSSKVVVWEEHSTLTKRIYRNTDRYIDWTDGKKVHLQQSVDITESSNVLEILKNILNAIDIRIYVSDLETDEILFANDKLTTELNLSGDIIGKKCWKIFWQKTERCEFCQKNRLKQNSDDVFVWESNTLIADKILENIDCIINWTDGKKAHIHQSFDITDMKRAQETLNRREKMLSALNEMAVLFLSHNDETFENVMNAGLKRVSEAAGIDSIGIFRALDKDGQIGQVYLWNGKPVSVKNKINAMPENPSIVRWRDIYIKGKCINGNVSDMEEDDANYLSQFGIKAIFFVPIFIRGEFWGVVTLEDHTNYRYFDEDVLDLLRSIAHLCANTVIREELTRNIHESIEQLEYRDNLLHSVNQVATILLSSETDLSVESFRNALHKSMGIMAKSVNVDRMYIWKNHMINDWLYCTQVYEWSDKAEPMQGAEITINIPFDNTAGLEETLSSGKCINNLVRNMSLEEQSQLAPQGIISILMVPVFIEDHFWGFVGFDDCYNERIFTETEETILRSASLLLANALLKNEMVMNIQNTSAQLELALEKTQAASRAKSEFLSRMSHEIRTPMNAIIGLSEIVKYTDNLEKIKFHIKNIDSSSRHLMRIIDDILEMTSIESGKYNLNYSDFNFKNLITQAIESLNSNIVEKRQTLKVNVDNNIPLSIVCDEHRLKQVVVNLILNAIKFTPDNGIISLNSKVIEISGNDYTILTEVIDNGIGIAKDEYDTIFLPFEQVDGGVTRKYGGAGLGLPICRQIIEQIGGKIWVESEVGKGSKFSFTIRVSIGESLQSTEQNSITRNFEPQTILLVEDVELNRILVQELLSDTKLDIECAENGRQALEIYTANPDKYNLIFMDINMPEMDGYTATRKIRELDLAQAKNIPIIAMTANVFQEDIEKCFESGMNGHIGKPIDSNLLINKIIKYIDLDCLRD